MAAVVPEPPATVAHSRLNLLPHEARHRAPCEALAILVAPGPVASVALAAIAIPLWQKRDYVITLNALTNDARAQAGGVEALRTELENKVGDCNLRAGRKLLTPSAFRVVDDVSRVSARRRPGSTQLEMKSTRQGQGNAARDPRARRDR